MTKKRVAILGGGCGAMSAAYYLSNTPHLREHLEVTVYQLGWRLGGKGASGRNAAYHNRIEEHGLHVWGGFYYNAFHMIQDAFAVLDRPPDCPLRTWTDTFEKYPKVAWQEWLDDQWVTWPVTTPTTSEIPGQGPLLPSLWSYLSMLIQWIQTALRDWPNDEFCAKLFDPGQGPPILLETLDVATMAGVQYLIDGSPHSYLQAAYELSRRAESLNEAVSAAHHDALNLLLTKFNQWLIAELSRDGSFDNFVRRTFIVTNLALALAIGLVSNHVFTKGWMVIDGYDLAEFLATYGAVPLSVASAPLRGYYDYFFAYEDGDKTKPRMSAGMGAYHLLRLIGEYKGGLFYKMSSGMGDSVFAPLYEVCKRNGVRFKFFHKLEQLVPSADGKSIETIRIGRQVDTIGDYEPLVFPKKVPSWPSAPLYDQIPPAQVEELKRRKVNLEDPWADWDDVETIELHAGRDFDAAVLGLSIGAFPMVCRDILALKPEWKQMVERVQSIQTQALQLWWKPSTADLGWSGGNVTGTAYAQPLESFSDMSQVLVLEEWPPDIDPKTVIYFCGPQLNPPSMPTGKDPAYGELQTKLAWENALAWAQQNVGHLYPNAMNATGLDYSLLVDPYNHSGLDRFYAQYARSNFAATERYVVDLPGTNKYRLEADTSGFTNLALAGDWLFTGLGGAVESAVIAGMQAAEALAGGISTPIMGASKSAWPRPVSVKPLINWLQQIF